MYFVVEKANSLKWSTHIYQGKTSKENARRCIVCRRRAEHESVSAGCAVARHRTYWGGVAMTIKKKETFEKLEVLNKTWVKHSINCCPHGHRFPIL